MKIKNILRASLVFCGFAAVLMSCSDNEEAFFTVTEDDAPRILNTDFPGAGFELNRDQNLQFQVLVTPADMTTVRWYDDDRLVHEGAEIDKPFEAGEYNLKIVATTVKGKETYRKIRMVVKPLENDPVTDDKPMERLQAPGQKAIISGSHLSSIKYVLINGQEAKVTSDEDGYIEYIVPAGLTNGQYRLSLRNENNELFGGGLVTISDQAAGVIISKSEFSAKAKKTLKIQGKKLNEVTGVSIDGKSCEIQSQSEEQIIMKVPEMEEGTYELVVSSVNNDVRFLKDTELVDKATIDITLTAEEIIWEGKWAVDWGHIWEANEEELAALKNVAAPGVTLRLYISRTDSEYAKGCAAVNWADIVYGYSGDDRADVEFTFEDTYVDFVLTQKSMELLEQNNFEVVGHGFDLLKITVVLPDEQELWSGKWAVDWNHIWEADAETVAELRSVASVGSTLRLYIQRTDSEYAKGCPVVDWVNIVTGGSGDTGRGDTEITFEDTVLEFVLTQKSMELLEQNKFQVVGHGFDLLKVTIE